MVIGGTETSIYCQATICRTCVPAVPRTIKVGLTKVENQAYHLSTLKKKKIFLTNLDQMFKRTAIDLNAQTKKTQQRLK